MEKVEKYTCTFGYICKDKLYYNHTATIIRCKPRPLITDQLLTFQCETTNNAFNFKMSKLFKIKYNVRLTPGY